MQISLTLLQCMDEVTPRTALNWSSASTGSQYLGWGQSFIPSSTSKNPTNQFTIYSETNLSCSLRRGGLLAPSAYSKTPLSLHPIVKLTWPALGWSSSSQGSRSLRLKKTHKSLHPSVMLTCFRLEFCISSISLFETPEKTTNHWTFLWSWPALGWRSASPVSRSLRLQKTPQITAPCCEADLL